MSTNTTKTYQKDAIRAAEELCYGKDVIKRLKAAKTDEEIRRIMVTARKEY